MFSSLHIPDPSKKIFKILKETKLIKQDPSSKQWEANAQYKPLVRLLSVFAHGESGQTASRDSSNTCRTIKIDSVLH